MDNCMKQKVILTGSDIVDIINALNSKIKSIPVDKQNLKASWVDLRDKLQKEYDNPKWKGRS